MTDPQTFDTLGETKPLADAISTGEALGEDLGDTIKDLVTHSEATGTDLAKAILKSLEQDHPFRAQLENWNAHSQ